MEPQTVLKRWNGVLENQYRNIRSIKVIRNSRALHRDNTMKKKYDSSCPMFNVGNDFSYIEIGGLRLLAHSCTDIFRGKLNELETERVELMKVKTLLMEGKQRKNNNSTCIVVQKRNCHCGKE